VLSRALANTTAQFAIPKLPTRDPAIAQRDAATFASSANQSEFETDSQETGKCDVRRANLSGCFVQLPGVQILFPVPAISSISSLSRFTNAPGSSS